MKRKSHFTCKYCTNQPSLECLIQTLEKGGINTVLRQNTEGIIYGVTYVDHRTKCVFNGSVLGKQYRAKGMLERCNKVQETFAVKQGFVKKPSSKIMLPNEQSAASATLQSKDNIDLLENYYSRNIHLVMYQIN